MAGKRQLDPLHTKAHVRSKPSYSGKKCLEPKKHRPSKAVTYL